MDDNLTDKAAEILENMDQKVDPCDDFYSFACGGFESKHVIPDDQSRVTTFSLISDKVTAQLRNLIERPIDESETESFKLVKKFYQSCLNKSKLSRFKNVEMKNKVNSDIFFIVARAEEVGLRPLKEVLHEFGGWPVVVGDVWDESNFVWFEMIYKFLRVGYSIDYFIYLSVTTDWKNSTARVIEVTTYFRWFPFA